MKTVISDRLLILIGSLVLIAFIAGCRNKYPTRLFEKEKNYEPGKGKIVKLQSCEDGDTCKFTKFKKPIQFARIDAPKIGGKCEQKGRKALRSLLTRLRRARSIRVVGRRLGYSNRLLAEVYVDDTNLNDWMVENDYAVRRGEDPC